MSGIIPNFYTSGVLVMINHISIAVEDPTRTADFLAKLWDGMVLPFPPAEDALIVLANDGKGSAVEVLPADTVLQPGDGLPDDENFSHETPTEQNEARFVRTEAKKEFSPVHLNISTHLSIGEVRELAEHHGWRNLVCNRDGGLFQLIEVWVDDRFMLEVMTEKQTARYREITDPAFIMSAFGAGILSGASVVGDIGLRA
jgi:hypothetical protein